MEPLETETAAVGRCQWCSAAVPTESPTCPGCGAALARRESIGDLVIPGVTDVDPALRAYAATPMRIPGASPTQAVATSVLSAAAAAGPAGAVLALGGLAAVAATELLGASRTAGSGVAPVTVGQPSEAARAMVQRLEEQSPPDG